MGKKHQKPFSHIYKATNKIKGKIYIGQTVKGSAKNGQEAIENRWNKEINESYGKSNL